MVAAPASVDRARARALMELNKFKRAPAGLGGSVPPEGGSAAGAAAGLAAAVGAGAGGGVGAARLAAAAAAAGGAVGRGGGVGADSA
eukprot:gene28340-36567_t